MKRIAGVVLAVTLAALTTTDVFAQNPDDHVNQLLIANDFMQRVDQLSKMAGRIKKDISDVERSLVPTDPEKYEREQHCFFTLDQALLDVVAQLDYLAELVEILGDMQANSDATVIIKHIKSNTSSLLSQTNRDRSYLNRQASFCLQRGATPLVATKTQQVLNLYDQLAALPRVGFSR